MTAPPHTRGSTILAVDSYFRTSGSPAHAGIDLLGLLCVVLRPGSPAHAGIDPRIRPRDLDDDGSPAHAGIDPDITSRSATSLGLPRTRGDRPGHYFEVRDEPGAPPHTRGSTSRGGIGKRPNSGSPAHAGIDPLDDYL